MHMFRSAASNYPVACKASPHRTTPPRPHTHTHRLGPGCARHCRGDDCGDHRPRQDAVDGRRCGLEVRVEPFLAHGRLPAVIAEYAGAPSRVDGVLPPRTEHALAAVARCPCCLARREIVPRRALEGAAGVGVLWCTHACDEKALPAFVFCAGSKGQCCFDGKLGAQESERSRPEHTTATATLNQHANMQGAKVPTDATGNCAVCTYACPLSAPYQYAPNNMCM